MCNQIRGEIRNFIWGGKFIRTRAKVKWDSLTFPSLSRGLGIINPKVQLKALVTGLSPSYEPWKEILKHHTDQLQLLVHGKGLKNKNIN
jgi:hypothetical protein